MPDSAQQPQVPPPGTTPVTPAGGLIRIGRSPARTSLPLVLLATAVGAVMLASLTVGLSGGRMLVFLIAFAGWAVVIGGSILTGLVLYYRPVAFDSVASVARLGRTTVPVSGVIAARREVSAAMPSAYLRYRFAATNGAWGRVLVAGRPMRGLRPEELRLLERFVAATAIADPPAPAGLPRSQRIVADVIGVDNVTQLQTYVSKRLVGKAELLAELRGEVLPPEPEEVDLSPSDLERQWQQDDRDAEPVVLRSAADTVRRVFGWATASAVLAGAAAVVVAAILEESSASGRLDSQTNDVVAAVVLPAVALGLVSYLGYALAATVSERRAQRAALTWLRGRDDQQVARGIPPRLLVPFLGKPPGHRLRMAGGFASAVVGGAGLIGGVAAMAAPDMPGAAVVAMLLVGLVVTWIAVVVFRRARRAIRAQHQLAARLGGRRLAAELAAAP